jgi:hypothetical protein
LSSEKKVTPGRSTVKGHLQKNRIIGQPSRLKKGQKMKKLTTAFSVIGIFELLTFSALAVSTESYDSAVIGKSDSKCDVKAVQDALNKGGRVLPKGAFDFGKGGN